MATHVVKVPDIGEGIAEVELVQWHVKPGDAVVEEQVLADVMTDKASVEIPSPVAGKVLAITGKPGDTIAVGSEMIRLEVEGKGNVAADGQDDTASAPESERSPARAPTLSRSVNGPVAEEGAAPAAQPTMAADEPLPTAVTRTTEERPIASPAVRRRAWELGIDLRTVRGSGAGGRIMQADLDAHVATPGKASSATPRSELRERDTETVVPIIGLRRRIAQQMQKSKRHIPHFTYVEEVDVTELEALRTRLNVKWQGTRGHLTLLPFVLRAIACAVPAFPEVNARYEDEEAGGKVTQFGAVHIGIATQTEAGLLVPVVRHAEARDLWDCAGEIARLADAARSAKIAREELSGSTITVTSLGPLGGIVTTPVINYPEVAIIGVNRVVERPVMRGGAIVPRRMMNLSSSFDHRIVDGMRGAAFVQALRGYLEAPATMFID